MEQFHWHITQSVMAKFGRSSSHAMHAFPFMSDFKSLEQIDRQLLHLIQNRAEAVQGLAESGRSPSALQDNQHFDRFAETADEALMQVMKHVGSYCREKIASRSISFLGPQFSYSHLAAIKYFGEGTSFAPVANIPAVFEAVHGGDAQYGLVPIENSTDGGVVDTLGMFVKRHMQICGEVLMPIHHNLLASGTREQIKQIHSKPQALSQCRAWLSAHFPGADLVEVGSTTAAAESAAGDPSIGAVASLPAGRQYGLNVLHQSIQDSSDNVTRFAVLGREDTQPTGDDRTSILFQVAHQPGSLSHAMKILSDAHLNLTWIESFPSPSARTEYLFFVEFRGHRSEPVTANAIKDLGEITDRLEVLGSYAIATL